MGRHFECGDRISSRYVRKGDCDVPGSGTDFQNLGIQDERLAGLYNNMSMAFRQKEDYGTAESCLFQALAIVRNLPDHKVEEATTYANLASVCYEKEEVSQGIEYVQRAIERFEM